MIIHLEMNRLLGVDFNKYTIFTFGRDVQAAFLGAKTYAGEVWNEPSRYDAITQVFLYHPAFIARAVESVCLFYSISCLLLLLMY